MKVDPTIIVDSREQNPLAFDLPTVTGTLDTGDYSVSGLTHLIAVERKSVPDLLACIGHGRERFKRELARLRRFRFRLLIVEADAATLELGEWRSKLKPAHVLGALAAWTVQFSLPIWLAGNHAAAGRFVERYLFQCARCVAMELASAESLLSVAGGPACVEAEV